MYMVPSGAHPICPLVVLSKIHVHFSPAEHPVCASGSQTPAGAYGDTSRGPPHAFLQPDGG
jgi:hypothetical protein